MKQQYTAPRLVGHGTIQSLTRDLGDAQTGDYIFNSTNEVQFGIQPGQTVPGDGGSMNIIIKPAP